MKKNNSLIPVVLLSALLLGIILLTGMLFFGKRSAPTAAPASETASLTEEETSQPEETVLPAEASAAESSSAAAEQVQLSAPEREPDASASAEETTGIGPVSGGVPASPNASADDPYPGLYAESAEFTDDNTQKILYLTFDDGPSDNTDRLLSILADHGVKATFFVSGQYGTAEERAERYRKILEAGHTIGLHTYSHDYEKIYASMDAYLSDMNKINEEVYAATGYQANLIRFPGGSASTHSGSLSGDLAAEMTRRGYTYHDWAVSCGDAEGKNLSADEIASETEAACLARVKSVILFHDTPSQDTTVEALDRIINDLEAEGYEFRALDNTIRPFQFTKLS